MSNSTRQTMPDSTVARARRNTVLVLMGDRRERTRLGRFAAAEGYLVVEAADMAGAQQGIAHARPDLVLVRDDRRGLAALAALRADADASGVAAVVLARRTDLSRILRAFEAGADDVIQRTVHSSELAARLRVRLERRPVPGGIVRDPVTRALGPEALSKAMKLEFERVRRTRRAASFAYLAFDEMASVDAAHGQRARDELLAQVVALVEVDGRRGDVVGLSRHHLALLLPETSSRGARIRLNRLVQKIHRHSFLIEGREMRLTPAVGFVEVAPAMSTDEAEERAWTALLDAATQLDLYPVEWRPAHGGGDDTDASAIVRFLRRHRTSAQVLIQQLACIGLPVLAYWMLDRIGIDITGAVYLTLVVALAITAFAIWVECIAAHRPQRPPSVPAAPYPPATAIIAAYLPNEAATIAEIVRSFLRQDYPDLQIILAYNTPRDLPIEDVLRQMAADDPRLVPLRVLNSASKAQNVNAALAHVTGEFVGVFDADHHPAQGAFRRAWRWISHGADVVQGHCVVRDGGQGFLQRLVTTEFEAIYAVAHPGRARVHGFGIFGGSNGYWRTALLRATRMRGFMLTEDIDSSMRVVAGGGRIVSDPGLISTELPPPHWRGLWNQRLRWAQGWSQVSLRHLLAMLRNQGLSRRQRVGLAYLLGWREVYPWISLQAFPILAYWFLRGSPPIDWFVPIFVATTLFTTSAGLAQAWSAYRLARPHLRRRRGWFVAYGLASFVFYTEYKNVVTRTAHLKELMREQQWKVTPRPLPAGRGSPVPLGMAVSRDAA